MVVVKDVRELVCYLHKGRGRREGRGGERREGGEGREGKGGKGKGWKGKGWKGKGWKEEYIKPNHTILLFEVITLYCNQSTSHDCHMTLQNFKIITIPSLLCRTAAGSWKSESNCCHTRSSEQSDSISVEGNSHSPASRPAYTATGSLIHTTHNVTWCYTVLHGITQLKMDNMLEPVSGLCLIKNTGSPSFVLSTTATAN